MFNLFPIAHAQTFSKVLKNPTVKDLFTKISENIISPLVTLLFAIAFLVFVYGIYGMISSSDDSDKRQNGKNSVLWGVLGMTIMLSVYGIIRLISNTVGQGDPFL